MPLSSVTGSVEQTGVISCCRHKEEEEEVQSVQYSMKVQNTMEGRKGSRISVAEEASSQLSICLLYLD